LPKAKLFKFCRYCGVEIPRSSVFCEECGTKLSTEYSGPAINQIVSFDTAGIVREGPAWEDIGHVNALESGLSTWIKGIVLEVVSYKDSKLIVLCETCGSALRVSENEYTCETCKQPRSGKFVFTGRVRIDDGTGVTDAVFSDIDEQALPAFNLAEVKHEMLRNHECQVTLGEGQILAILGREIEVYGTAKQDGNGKFELIAKKALLASGSVGNDDEFFVEY
jgi:hypothetical protein